MDRALPGPPGRTTPVVDLSAAADGTRSRSLGDHAWDLVGGHVAAAASRIHRAFPEAPLGAFARCVRAARHHILHVLWGARHAARRSRMAACGALQGARKASGD